jgi:hypothetical protein
MPYADPFDSTTPIAAEASSQGDDRIRELKRAIEQRMADLANNWPAGPVTPKIPLLAIITGMLADKAVTGAKIADDTITALQIAIGAVGTAELADGGVTGDKVAANAIDTVHVALLAITDALIASVDGSKIIDASIDGAVKLKDGSVTASKLAAIGTGGIADGAVTTPKLADLSVTIAKLAVALKDVLSVTKYVDVVVVAGNQGSDTSTEVANAAFAGAAINDAVRVGLPNANAWAAQEQLNTWLAFVDAAGHVKMRVVNSTGGAKNWPGGTFRLSITKSASDWGL